MKGQEVFPIKAQALLEYEVEYFKRENSERQGTL